MEDSWYSELEMLNDLRAVGASPCQDAIHPVMNKPPARNITEELPSDIEQELRYGDIMREREVVKPDLINITKMIDMVNDKCDRYYYNEPERCLQNSAIVLSKLNPNVNDFVPKTNKISLQNVKKSYSNYKSCDGKQEAQTSKLPNSQSNSSSIKSVENLSKIANENTETSNNSVQSDVEVIAEELKTKIWENAKSNSNRKKMAKNVALANLMKLYATQTDTSPTTLEDKSKEDDVDTLPKNRLMTPNDFYVAGEVKILNDLKHTETPITDKSKENVSEITSREVQLSIDKVNKWLETPIERVSEKVPETSYPCNAQQPSTNCQAVSIPLRSPAKSCGFITKSIAPSTKTTSISTSPKKIKHNISSFQSKNSDTFEKLSKARDEVKKQALIGETVWEKAERLMKEREEKIRNKRSKQ